MGFFKDLFSESLWSMDITNFSFIKRRIIRFIKLARITLSTFMENRMGFQCVALSYFVALAVIPFVAFLFAVSSGVGITDRISRMLYGILPNYPDLIDIAIEKAKNIIAVAQTSGVGLISAAFFLWTILWLFFQVERVFNNVWGIRRVPRKMYKRVSFYVLFLLISPFLLLVFGTGVAFYSNFTSLIGLDIIDMKTVTKVLGWIIFFITSTFTFSAMYKFIPAVKVKYIYAFKSAIVAALCFTGFQYLYLETQTFVNRMNGVYGALAAIPLFLIWTNISWQIIIYGAELSYGYQHVDTYHIPEWEDETKIGK